MARVQVQREHRPVEVDLWGELYATKAITKPLKRQVEAVAKKLEEQVVKHLGQMLDLSLDAAGEAEQPKPSELVLAKFKDGEIELVELQDFVDRLGVADAGAQYPN